MNDFKSRLLDYLLGNINKSIGINEPNLTLNEYTNGYNSYIVSNIKNINTNSEGIATLSIIDYVQFNNYILLCCNYIEKGNSEKSYGALFILDDSLMPVKILTEYSSGTKMNFFVMINIDEDGNIYCVDDVIGKEYSDNHKYRFLLLNNVIASGLVSGEFNAILRQSYFFPDQYNNFRFGYYGEAKNKLLKKPKYSSYTFIGQYKVNDQNRLAIGMLNINVGIENEWSLYYSSNAEEMANYYIGTYLIWNNDDIYLKICGYSNTNGEYREYIFQNKQISLGLSIKSENLIEKVCIKNDKEVYAWLWDTGTDYYYDAIGKVDYEKKTFNVIFAQETEKNYFGNILSFELCNNNVFVRISNATPISPIYEVSLGIIFNDKLYLQNIGQSSVMGSLASDLFFVKRDFNLYKILKQNENTVSCVELIFSESNYNGKSYSDENMLVPNSAILYDEKENIVFARNLYNKSINENVTTSTVEIPNSYLNDIDIKEKCLMSLTNFKLFSNAKKITKNIYETLFINFIKSLMITDENDISKPKKNAIASAFLNKSVNSKDCYENAKMTKIRINYKDGQTKVMPFSVINSEGKHIKGEKIVVENEHKINEISSFQIDGAYEQETSELGKNLFIPISNATRNGVTLTRNNDGTYNIKGTATSAVEFTVFQDINLIPFVDGETYTFSANQDLSNSEVNARFEYYNNNTWIAHAIPTLYHKNKTTSTLSIPSNANRLRYCIGVPNGATVDMKNLGIQIEKGDNATEYEPFTPNSPSPDYPSDIEVIEGKNLFLPITNATLNGVSLTRNNDGSYNIKGTATGNANFTVFEDIETTSFKDGETYTLSANQNLPNGVNVRFEYYSDNAWIAHAIPELDNTRKVSNRTLSIPKEATRVRYCIAVQNGFTVDIKNLGIQLEKGNTATEYVPYQSIGIKQTGKNLFKIVTGVSQGITCTYDEDKQCYVLNGTSTAVASFRFVIPEIIGEYTISYTVKELPNPSTVFIRTRDIEGVIIDSLTIEDSLKRSITSTKGNIYYTDINVATNVTLNNFEIYPQLEKGNTATEYEPYQEEIYHLNIKDNFVGALPDGTKDFVKCDGNEYLEIGVGQEKKKYWLEKHVGKVVLTGNENWELSTREVENYTSFFINYFLNANNNTPIICNCFKYADYSYWDTNVAETFISHSYSVNRNLVIRLKSDIASNVDDFKTWLKEQYNNGTPVTIYYELATPEIIQLGEQPNFELFEKTNILEVISTLKTELTINYLINFYRYAILNFSLNVDKQINKIEFISNDETTVYHTIDASSLLVGKVYDVEQKVEIR